MSHLLYVLHVSLVDQELEEVSIETDSVLKDILTLLDVVTLFVAATEHGLCQDGMLLLIQCLGKERTPVELCQFSHLFFTFGVLGRLKVLQLIRLEGSMEDRGSLTLEVLLARDLTLICILKQLVLLTVPGYLIQ